MSPVGCPKFQLSIWIRFRLKEMTLRRQGPFQSNGKRPTDKQKMQELSRKTNTTLHFSMREANSQRWANSSKMKNRSRLPDPDRVSNWQTLTMTDPRWQAAFQYKTTRNSTLCRIKFDTERLNNCLNSHSKTMEHCVILTLLALRYLVDLHKDISSLAN